MKKKPAADDFKTSMAPQKMKTMHKVMKKQPSAVKKPAVKGQK